MMNKIFAMFQAICRNNWTSAKVLLAVAVGVIVTEFVLATVFSMCPAEVLSWSVKPFMPPVMTPRLSPLPPHQHVFYLKTHKTGSATTSSVLVEYCRSHDLIPLIPRALHINQAPPFDERKLLLSDKIGKYDMLFHHLIFTPEILKYLHNDTFAFTTLREPFNQVISAFMYYREVYHVGYVSNVKGPDPLSEFLSHPSKYDKGGYMSFTNNRQSVDLGYNISHSFQDIEYINMFIKGIEQQFNIVLITEYFNEGLVILKRLLNWKTQDIVYMTKNEGPKKKTTALNSSTEILSRKIHSQFSKADIMLYDHFLNRFNQIMAKEDGLEEEVAEFRTILNKVGKYCNSVDYRLDKLVIDGGNWTNGFIISQTRCKWMNMTLSERTNILHGEQKAMFKDL